MKKSLLYIIMLFILTLGLQSCCDKSFCSAHPGGFEDTFYLALNTDSLLGKAFTGPELQKIYLDKYPKNGLNSPVISRANADIVTLLGDDDNQDFKNYDYVLTNEGGTFRFEITDLAVGGEEFKNKCSSCYYNTQKTCKVNGMIYDRSGSMDYIVLFKP
ncbi:MAG: hypothetical protein K1X92_02895 [Bacteroidia bacterium]|nr:hypothetical protein [Bacteroidia bacterium]